MSGMLGIFSRQIKIIKLLIRFRALDLVQHTIFEKIATDIFVIVRTPKLLASNILIMIRQSSIFFRNVLTCDNQTKIFNYFAENSVFLRAEIKASEYGGILIKLC